MDIENQTPEPAGNGESTSLPETLTLAAAAERLERNEDAQPASETPASGTPDETHDNTSAAAEEGETATEPETEGGEPSEDGESTSPDEPAPLEFESLHGNTKLRLRDGSTVTVGELKKRWGELQEAGRTKQEIEQERQAFQAQQAQVHQYATRLAQEQQYFQQIVPHAIAALEAQLPQVPPLPPPELLETNFLEYQKQKDAHDRARVQYETKAQEIQQLREAQAYNAQQQQLEQQQRMHHYVQTQRAQLLEALPELRDPKRAEEFGREYLDAAAHYGFSPEEANGVYDHRVMLMARDAMAYRKLKANPPKPAAPQQKPAAPVAQPGRRQSAPEAQASKREELLSKARSTGGDLRSIAALVAQLD